MAYVHEAFGELVGQFSVLLSTVSLIMIWVSRSSIL